MAARAGEVPQAWLLAGALGAFCIGMGAACIVEHLEAPAAQRLGIAAALPLAPLIEFRIEVPVAAIRVHQPITGGLAIDIEHRFATWGPCWQWAA